MIVTDDATGELVVLGNGSDAAATYAFLRANTALPVSRTPVVAAAGDADTPGAIVALLESRKLPFTTWTGWHRPACVAPVTAKQWSSLVSVACAVPDTP